MLTEPAGRRGLARSHDDGRDQRRRLRFASGAANGRQVCSLWTRQAPRAKGPLTGQWPSPRWPHFPVQPHARSACRLHRLAAIAHRARGCASPGATGARCGAMTGTGHGSGIVFPPRPLWLHVLGQCHLPAPVVRASEIKVDGGGASHARRALAWCSRNVRVASLPM